MGYSATLLCMQASAYRYALTAVGLWSTVATAFKISLRQLSPLQLLAISSLASVCCLALILSFQGKWPQAWRDKKPKLSLLQGALNPLLYYLILFQAYDQLPAQEAQPLNYTWAFTLSLLAIPFLGQRFTWADGLGGLVAYAGVWVIATRGQVFQVQFDQPVGVALALLSTVVWALYWMINTRDTRDPVIALFWNFVCALPCVWAALGWSVWSQPGSGPGSWQGTWDTVGLAICGAVYIGFVEMGVAFVCWLKAMKLTERTAQIAHLIFLSPFVSLILISQILGEQLYHSTLPGLMLIVAGLVLQSQFKAKKPASPSGLES